MRCRLILAIMTLAIPMAAETAHVPFLPKQFAGWQLRGKSQVSTNPAKADPANAALLAEFGFTDVESASYTRDDGRQLTIKAARFPDASGAYGAFTYYLSPAMLIEKIGDHGVSLNNRILFYRGNILVDAIFQSLTAMSASELRELAAALPSPPGNGARLAEFLSYLPRERTSKTLPKYIVGPIGLFKAGAPLPAELVDFSKGAEVGLENYSGPDRDATLMVVNYPTHQIAADHLRRLQAAQDQNTKQPQSVPALAAGPIFSKRSGPLVVIVSGKISPGDAQSLLSSINYDANVTWNEANPFSKSNNVGTLVVNALLLSGILMVVGVIFSLAFGGIRVLLGKLMPDRVRPPDADEFISLGLQETSNRSPKD